MNAIAPTLNDRTSFRRPVRIAVVLCLVCVLAFSMLAPASAATIDSLEDGITNGIWEAYKLIRNIATLITPVVFAINCLHMLFGGKKGRESGKKGILICVLAIAAVCLAPLVVKFIVSWFERVGDCGVFDTTSS